MANLIGTARKLATAINMKYSAHLVINSSEFFGGEGNAVKMYIVKDAYSIKGEYSDKELFRSASSIYVCLFLRDLLYFLDGKEIPDAENEGYLRVRMKRNADASMEYIKEKYIGTDSDFVSGE